jgi:hypothetical protein
LLTLKRDVAPYHDADYYWIDPHSYLIIRARSSELEEGEHRRLTSRETSHRPKPNKALPNATPKFNPPN